MKLIRKVGATSEIWQIFIQDSSSTTGAGLTGLTNASGSLTAYYHRDTDTTATVISLVSMTVGTFTSSGFKEIDATNMPGFYQFCPPNAALASGAKSCVFMLKGASNMAPLPIEVDLDAQVDVTHWNGTAVSSPATAGIPDVNVKNINNVAAATPGSSGGILISGSNSGTTTLGALTCTGSFTISDGLLVSRSSSNTSAITATGNGTGSGIVATSGGGATGNGIQATAASTNGSGMVLTKSGSGSDFNATSTPLTLAKTTNITGFNDIAATAIVSSGAITTSGGAVSTVTTVTNQLTAAQIATGVWQDTTAGDFTVASSIGKSLYTTGNAPGAASGLALVGSNMGTVTSVSGAVGSVTGNVGGNVTGSVGSVATGGITRASLAADTGLQPIRSNTAQAGAATSITLDASASASDNFYNNDLILITGGTGVGQARFITAYVGATKVATVATWVTTPDNTSTFAILPFDAVAGASAPTAAQVATAVWTDLLAGSDFSTVASIGKLLKDDIDAAISSRGTSTLTQTQVTGGAYSVQSASCVLGDARIANLDATISSRGTSTLTQTQVTGGAYNIQSSSCVLGDARIANLDAAVTSRMATYTQPTGFLAATFPATVASTTNISAGTITTVTNLTNAPTAGDFTATMKTSLNAATPASVTGAVGSVTGNVGGNVTGSVGSVVAAVGITSNRKKSETATFEFTMTSATTGAPLDGLTVTGVISKDGGAFASTSNTVTETSDGWYQIVLSASEMTANNIALQFSAAGATIRDISIQTQP